METPIVNVANTQYPLFYNRGVTMFILTQISDKMQEVLYTKLMMQLYTVVSFLTQSTRHFVPKLYTPVWVNSLDKRVNMC